MAASLLRTEFTAPDHLGNSRMIAGDMNDAAATKMVAATVTGMSKQNLVAIDDRADKRCAGLLALAQSRRQSLYREMRFQADALQQLGCWQL